MSLSTFVSLLPKAELHLHIEGTLEPELLFRLASKNNVSLDYKSVEQVREAYKFTCLQSFLDIYYKGAQVLLHREDFKDLASEYLTRAESEGIKHVEMFFDPQTHTTRGVPFSTVIGGLCDAIQEHSAKISASLILCFLRHLSEEDGFKVLEEALPYKDKFIGVGLDSGEKGNPPSKFTRLFAKCREEGLRIVAHAGEEGPPAFIRQALDLLHAERIDHGFRCVEDPDLVSLLKTKRVPLTVCPLSNLSLQAVPSLEAHPVGQLIREQLLVTFNSDDPAYFGGYLNANFVRTLEALGLGIDHALTLAKNSFEASFIEQSQKDAFIKQIDEYHKAFVEQQ